MSQVKGLREAEKTIEIIKMISSLQSIIQKENKKRETKVKLPFIRLKQANKMMLT